MVISCRTPNVLNTFKGSLDNAAFVEYSVEVQFKAHNSDFTCKMIAYTTSCKIMFQPLGVEATTKISSSKSISRYFVDTFFLPWCETAYQKKEFDETALLEAINAEIRRLDLKKVDSKKSDRSRSRNRLASIASSEAKCVSRSCKYPGLNTSNKAAVGVCSKCDSFEHFECSKTKPEDRDDILKGVQKYICTGCFLKDPSLLPFDPSTFTSEVGLKPKGCRLPIHNSLPSPKPEIPSNDEVN